MKVNSVAQIVELIRTELQVIGKGVEGNPVRRITQYWTKEGELLFEIDPCKEQRTLHPRDGQTHLNKDE